MLRKVVDPRQICHSNIHILFDTFCIYCPDLLSQYLVQALLDHTLIPLSILLPWFPKQMRKVKLLVLIFKDHPVNFKCENTHYVTMLKICIFCPSHKKLWTRKRNTLQSYEPRDLSRDTHTFSFVLLCSKCQHKSSSIFYYLSLPLHFEWRIIHMSLSRNHLP